MENPSSVTGKLVPFLTAKAQAKPLLPPIPPHIAAMGAVDYREFEINSTIPVYFKIMLTGSAAEQRLLLDILGRAKAVARLTFESVVKAELARELGHPDMVILSRDIEKAGRRKP